MAITITSPFCPEKPEGLSISDDGYTLLSVGKEVTGKVVVPEGITHINDWAFSECSVQEIELPSTIRTFGDRVFEDCKHLSSITIPEGVKELTFSMFRGCLSLWKVKLPKSLTIIGNSAFEYCRNLKNICIPENVEVIEDEAFGECSALVSCQLSNKLETIGHGAFCGCASLNRIQFPASLKAIEWQAFMGCSGLGYVFIPEKVCEIGIRAFAGTNAYIDVDDNNLYYSSSKGSLFDKKQERMFNYHASSPYCIIDTPNTLKNFDGGVFQGLNILKEIKIAIKTESLSTFPLYGCANLRKIILPDGLIKFDGCASCPNLEEIYLPDSIEEISQCAFEKCTSLKTIKLPKNLKKMGYSHQGQVFSGCTSLEEIELDCPLDFIASSTFSGCLDLKSIKLPDSITYIDYSAFRGCSNLKSIILPNNIADIKSGAFSGCSSLKELIIPPSVKTIGSEAFKDCKELKKIVCLSKNVQIDNTAFSGCEKIRSIEVDSFSISDLFVKFYDCINLEKVIYYDNDTRKTFDVQSTRSGWKNELKLMSMYYYNMDMNIIRVKGCSKGLSSFKEPYNDESSTLNCLKKERIDKSTLLNLKWDNISGIALVLDYNGFQAIDVDGIVNPEDMSNMVVAYLSYLGLPDNYPWVIKSGSGKGFHIIFVSERIDKNIDVYPFTPTNQAYKNIEIRTGGILVLPPSIHYSGKNYEFINNEMPDTLPLKITTDRLNDFILKVCGDVSFCSYTFNKKPFDLCDFKKIKSIDHSFDTQISYSEDSEEWLTKCNSPYSYNTYAIKLVLGKGVKSDRNKALEYFMKADNDYAYFNIASLMSVGYFYGNLEQVNYYLDKINLDKLYTNSFEQTNIEPEERVEKIKQNAELYTKQGALLLFFDTETTGLPKNYDLPSSDTENWPRLVQISWILMADNGQRLNNKTYTIKPDGYSIPESARKIHGITTEFATEFGYDLNEVLMEFLTDFNHANLIVGHNISYDKKIIGAELIRQGLDDVMDSKDSLCTMKSTKDFCGIRGFFGLKYPKLQELYKKLFGQEFNDAHNASSDIEATQKCYWELKRLGIV